MSNDIDVREAVEEAISYERPATAREINEACDDTFIQYQGYDAEEAFKRLSVLRSWIRDFEFEINKAGTRNLPNEIEEMYESLKIKFREIERKEIELITYAK